MKLLCITSRSRWRDTWRDTPRSRHPTRQVRRPTSTPTHTCYSVCICVHTSGCTCLPIRQANRQCDGCRQRACRSMFGQRPAAASNRESRPVYCHCQLPRQRSRPNLRAAEIGHGPSAVGHRQVIGHRPWALDLTQLPARQLWGRSRRKTS